ncbi:MAG TPA: HEAT repeat domain-containing protein [Planctomycetota bacterium]|jgi:hypothetical protein
MFSVRTLLCTCLTIAGLVLFALSSTPGFWGARVIAKWKGGQGVPRSPGEFGVSFSTPGSPKWDDDFEALRNLGPVGVHALCKTLRSDDPKQRARSLIALQSFGPRAADAVSALVPMLDEQDYWVFRQAVGCLTEIGPPAKPALPKLEQLREAQKENEENEVRPRGVISGDGMPDTVVFLPSSKLSLLNEAIRNISTPTSRPQAQTIDHDSKGVCLPWFVKATLPLAVNNGRMVGLVLTLLFGTLSVWSFWSDRRHFAAMTRSKGGSVPAATAQKP